MISVVAFDLDDTLYPERDYVDSGFRAVARALTDDVSRQQRLVDMMHQLAEDNPGRVFDRLLSMGAHRGWLASACVEDLVKLYREHWPRIELYEDASVILDQLQRSGLRTALITDGPAVSQWNKIRALGLHERVNYIIVTDELGPGRMYWKPHIRAFKQLLEHFSVPASQACYVGDNVAKDFIGANQVGMRTILVRRNLGYYKSDRLWALGPSAAPDIVVNSLYELLPVVGVSPVI